MLRLAFGSDLPRFLGEAEALAIDGSFLPMQEGDGFQLLVLYRERLRVERGLFSWLASVRGVVDSAAFREAHFLSLVEWGSPVCPAERVLNGREGQSAVDVAQGFQAGRTLAVVVGGHMADGRREA